MSRTVITLEIDTEHEDLLRQYAGFLEEMKDLAATAPDGSVLAACEDAVIEWVMWLAHCHKRLGFGTVIRL